ncbi:MAG: hypothetical protein JRF33_03035 [Deltaproteobacteria bacterium]|nr:hypothetical protein [Deltaproteobacteria bacterium]
MVLTKTMPILLVLLLAGPVLASRFANLPEDDWSIGPGIAYSNLEGEHGFALNLDTAYTSFIFSASANLKLMRHENLTTFLPQLELSAWFLLNMGGGVGYSFGDLEGPVLHVFVGLPYGDDWLPTGPFDAQFIEPYYRLNFIHTGGEWLFMHEVGLMLKVSTYLLDD